MIKAIEYVTQRGGQTFALAADKLVHERNAWHLKTISGNGLMPTDALGSESFGIAGESYNGLALGARDIKTELYADGFSPEGCQQLLSDASRQLSVGNDGLGVLKLTNGLGETFRIAARATDFDIKRTYRRSALVSAVFHCPYAYFESDTLNIVPIYAIEGGKEYPINEGLERPYTFGNVTGRASDESTIAIYNAGDVEAPCVLKLFGAGLSRAEITNQTTGAQIIVSGMSVGGIEINTDVNSLYAVFDDGTDASAYVSLFSDVSAFVLAPGNNVINIQTTASSVTAAGTQIEWRGRYSLCL